MDEQAGDQSCKVQLEELLDEKKLTSEEKLFLRLMSVRKKISVIASRVKPVLVPLDYDKRESYLLDIVNEFEETAGVLETEIAYVAGNFGISKQRQRDISVYAFLKD